MLDPAFPVLCPLLGVVEGMCPCGLVDVGGVPGSKDIVGNLKKCKTHSSTRRVTQSTKLKLNQIYR